MPPRHCREKIDDMGAGEPRESELEQELDSLYRKVAGLDQRSDEHSRTAVKTDEKAPAAVNIQRPISTRAAQKKRRRFLSARFAWGLVFVLFFAGTIGFFFRPGAYDRGTVADTPPGGRQGRYAIQLRAYPEGQKQNAITFLDDLRKRSPDASMETVLIAERGVWHRILLGNFSTLDEAAEYQKKNSLAREYPYSFIQRKFASGP
jgi:hypothetical protein